MSGSRTLVLVAQCAALEVAPSVKLSCGLHLRQEHQTSAGDPPPFSRIRGVTQTQELSWLHRLGLGVEPVSQQLDRAVEGDVLGDGKGTHASLLLMARYRRSSVGSYPEQTWATYQTYQ
jgi:hypothetical protein